MQGQKLQVLVGLGVRVGFNTTAGLLDFDFESFRVLFPFALRKFALHFGDGCERSSFFAEFIFGVGFPVQGCVRLWTIHLRQFREFSRRISIVFFIEGFAAVVVKLLQAFLFVLFGFAPVLLAFQSLLFALALGFFRFALCVGINALRERGTRAA